MTIPKLKVFYPLWLLLFVFSMVAASPVSPKIDEVSQVRVVSYQDNMVTYMHSINPKLDNDVAYRLADSILLQSNKYHLPVDLIMGLIKVESRFDQYAISSSGALGFWQVMPSKHADKVYKMMATSEIVSKNVYEPETNSALGAKILYDCLRMHKNRMDKALLCYNGSQWDVDEVYAKLVFNEQKNIKRDMKG